jgi:carbonic anhydrase
MKPGIEPVLSQSGDLESSAVTANVRHNVDRLRHAAPILADLADRDELRVAGGVYDLATGKVELV